MKRALVVVAIAVALAAPVAAAEMPCSGTFTAYDSSHSVPKSERKAGRAKACSDARNDLAMLAWQAGIALTLGQRVDTGTIDERTRFESARYMYRLNEDLAGGTCYDIDGGDKKQLKVKYCVPPDRFRRAQAQFKLDRQEEIDSTRQQFREIERAIAVDQSFDYAAARLTDLVPEVEGRVLGGESYTSPLTNETLSFDQWIRRWNGELGESANYAGYLVRKASENIDAGHLGRASSQLDEALRAKPHDIRALQERDQIEGLRARRREILDRAAAYAASGRFAAANRSLEKAMAIDSDDAASLEQTATTIASSRASFKELNPRWTFDIGFTLGSLGLDTSGTADAVTQASGVPVGFGFPFGLDVGGGLRFGRFGRVFLEYGYQFSALSGSGTGADAPSLDTGNLSVGVEFRNVRSRPRRPVVLAGGGFRLINASLNKVSAGTFPGSDSATGAFIRVGVEFSMGVLYLEQGLNFSSSSSSDPSVFQWSNGTELSVRFRI